MSDGGWLIFSLLGLAIVGLVLKVDELKTKIKFLSKERDKLRREKLNFREPL